MLETNKYVRFETLVLILLAILLNFSSIIKGVNFTFADIILVFILFFLFIIQSMKMPIKVYMIIIFILTFSLFSSLIAWLFYDIDLNLTKILIALLKLIILIFYFIFGYVISKKKRILKFIRYLSFSISYINLIVIILFFLFGFQKTSFIFYSSNRIKGFLNDPNLYSIYLLISAAYIYIYINMKHLKFFMLASLFLGILLTNSKTGLLILLLLLLILFLAIYKKNTTNRYLKFIINGFVISSVILVFFYIDFIRILFPYLDRTLSLFSDLNNSINSNGSSRTILWFGAFKIIQEYPWIGVGQGTYIAMMDKMIGLRILSHMTFLQVLAEFGVIIGGLICLVYFRVVFRYVRQYFYTDNKMIKFIFIFLLIFTFASFSLSLNNFRIAFIMFGYIAFEKFNLSK